MATCFEKFTGDTSYVPLGETKEATVLMIGQAVTTLTGALASLVVLSLAGGHLKHYSQPEHQRYLVRLLLLVPLAATISSFGFKFSKQQTYMAVPLLLYVGIAVADLLRLMMGVVGREGDEIKEAFRFRKPRRMIFPLRWIWFRPGHHKHLPLVRLAAHQCAIILPLTAILAAFLQEVHIHCPHHLAFKLYPQAYIHIALLLSCNLAIFAIVNFYYTAQSDLKEDLGLLRVLTILALLFLPIYQHILVDILVESGIIVDGHTMTKESLATKLLCLIGNIELLALSLIFYLFLGYQRMQCWELTSTPLVRSLAHTLDIRGVFGEIFRSLRFVVGRQSQVHDQYPTGSKSGIHSTHGPNHTIPRPGTTFSSTPTWKSPRCARTCGSNLQPNMMTGFAEALNKNHLKSPVLIHYRANDDFRGHEFNPHRLSSPKPSNNSLEQFSSMSSLNMASKLRNCSPKHKVHFNQPSFATLDLTTSPSFPHIPY
ncbi:hypothetical protein DSO57_1014530 [Entomophthora muscae]|uniref:Uncharacterized protein n=1 Tax=Entomophthora muscae TaxID=34485 RepID=A0ACC2U4G3_9FUNG|nr:hypothetical protein DSO57_1014530 [Entomophthora muscae]